MQSGARSPPIAHLGMEEWTPRSPTPKTRNSVRQAGARIPEGGRARDPPQKKKNNVRGKCKEGIQREGRKERPYNTSFKCWQTPSRPSRR